MSEQQRPGQDPREPADDDVVVPHPFGPGARDEPPAEAVAEGPAPDEPEPEEAEEAEAEEPETEAEEAEAEESEPEEPETELEPEEPETELEAGEPEPEDEGQPARRRPRDPLAAALIGVLTVLLGFAIAVQVRTVGEDEAYAGAREEDLVRILDDLNAREERLRDQIADQRSALEQLSSSDSRSAAALEEARARAEAIGILNGTIPAQGPGLVMTIRDPDDEVRVSDIVDAIQELRGAGAETMQIDDVRVGVSTAVTGTPGNLMVDGRPITAPYEFVVIGSPQDMQTALNIPGGVAQDLTRQGATVTIEPSEQVVVDALRPLDTPQYASPDTD
ncbi:UNVERIFIED_ORG: DUF881 domain-containing protein [Bacillus sp. AZ43]